VESRKVQKVGASTLSVSLPRDWVEKLRIKKGDLLTLDEQSDGALKVAIAGKDTRERQVEEFVIDADLCDEAGMLGRIIIGNYVLGRNLLRVRSKGRIKSHHIHETRTAAMKLMGLGIMQETPEEIELQCSIDTSRFPMETVLKRLYTIGATIHKEAIEALTTGQVALAKDAMLREDEADTMYYLALRLLLSAQTDPILAEKIGLKEQLPIVGNRLIAKNLETIGDYAEIIAKNAVWLLESGKKLDDDLLLRLRRVSELAARINGDAMAAVVSRDIRLANRAVEARFKLEEEEEALTADIIKGVKDPGTATHLRHISWGLRRIAEYGSENALIGFNRYLERPSNLSKPEGWTKAKG
jgi:phosphate uptake regulator